jgi:hypothetical protein
MVSNQEGEERVQENKGCAERRVRNDGEQGSEDVDFFEDEYVTHDTHTSGPGKSQQ